MLLGAKLFVYTDHRNLTHKLSQFTTQRVLRWRLLLEEYGPTFAYLPGPQNVIADALSRVPTTLVHFLVNMPTAQSPRPPPVPGPSSTSHIDSYSSLLSSPDMASHLTTYLPLAEGLLAMPERVAQDSEAVESKAPTNSNTPLLSDSEAVLHDTHLFISALRCSRPTAFSLPNSAPLPTTAPKLSFSSSLHVLPLLLSIPWWLRHCLLLRAPGHKFPVADRHP